MTRFSMRWKITEGYIDKSDNSVDITEEQKKAVSLLVEQTIPPYYLEIYIILIPHGDMPAV